MTTRKSVCYAYYGDGKFLGWYADSFGSVRPNSPKVYGDTEKQREVITKNFRNKLSKLNEKSELDLRNPLGSTLLNNGLNKDKDELSKFLNVELRVVECPEYDGPGDKRGEWIYADYAKVKEWASTEPTEFLDVVKNEK